MKRLFAVTLAALLLFALFTGCADNTTPAPAQTSSDAAVTSQPSASSGPKPATAAPTDAPDSPYNFALGKFETDSRGFATDFYEYELPISTTDEVLTMLTYSFTMQAYPEAGYATMQLPTKDREMTGVNVEYIITPAMNSTETFRVLIASDDLPDICSGVTMMYKGTPVDMVEDGYFINIYDYIGYAPNYTYMACNYDPKDTDLYQSVFYYDDFIPAFYGIMKDPVRGGFYFMRGDWLEKFGLTNKDIVTWDDLHEAFLLAKTQIPSCEYPFVLRKYIELTEGANFTSYDTVPLIIEDRVGVNYVVDGKVKISNMNENDREFMTMLSGLYAEGLISPNWTAVSRAADSDSSITNNEHFYVAMQAAESSYFEENSTDPNCKWVPATPPLRYEGQKLHLGGNISRIVAGSNSIAAKCENIELAVTWLDWRFSNTGGDLWSYGVEGETWELNEQGKRQATDFALNNPAGLALSYFLLIYAVNVHTDSARIDIDATYMYPGGDITLGYCRYLTNWLKDNHDGAYVYPVGARLNLEQAERLGNLVSDVSTYMNENYALFVDGSKNIDADWDSYIAGLYQVGIQEIIDIYQEAYDNFIAA
ncbi:MAG: hypothetical protein GXY20_05690 [Clostridiales bacterium]|nr:hypothetical protein [Clostridiales bacterium]